MTQGWSAGAAQAPFAVPPGTPMAGYAARVGGVTGELDPLTVGALVLTVGHASFVLIAADLAAVDASLVDEVAAAAGLDRDALAMCASHTHAGPAGVIARMHPSDGDGLIPALRAAFVAACVSVIDAARASSEPVELLFGQAESEGLAANRNALEGPFDPRVSVLATRNRAGRLTSMVTQFACHPTILSAENRLVSADFPGAYRRAIEAQAWAGGESPVALFVNGAAGDVSTRFTRQSQDMSEVERVGRGVALAAIRALDDARPLAPEIELARVSVTLTPRSLDDLSVVGSGPSSGDSVAERRKAETRAQGAMLLERLAQAGPDAIRHAFDVPVWRLGELRLVGIPGELFASLGARIGASASEPVLVLGYANGYVGYLVDSAAEEAGTYEALASPFARGSGDLVVGGAVGALSRLSS